MFEGSTNSSVKLIRGELSSGNVKLIRGESARGCDVLGTTKGGSGTNQTAVGIIYHTQHLAAVDQKPFLLVGLLGTWVSQ